MTISEFIRTRRGLILAIMACCTIGGTIAWFVRANLVSARPCVVLIRDGAPAGCYSSNAREFGPRPYQVVPLGKNAYRIAVPTAVMPFDDGCATCNPPRGPLPDTALVDRKVAQIARDYCAKIGKPMVVTGGGFDMGPGISTIFRCGPPVD